jgi:hypothetical protein
MRVNGKNRPRTHERNERTLRSCLPFGDTLRPRPGIMPGMINTSDIFSIGENASACASSAGDNLDHDRR